MARALVVNSGIRHAFTGKLGREATEWTAKLAAKAVGAEKMKFSLASSTEWIGEPARRHEISKGILDELAARARPDGWLDAAKGDHDHRHFSESCHGQGQDRRCRGDDQRTSPKGAGMIAPDMATMLSYVFTDAAIGAERLAKAAVQGRENTRFNAVTVDSDTSDFPTL